MEVVGLVLVSVGLMLTAVAFVRSVRSPKPALALAGAIRRLREQYGLDRQRWAEVRRSVHGGKVAPAPVREATRAYATALLNTPGHGLGSPWVAVQLAGALAFSTGVLLNEIADGRVIWLTVAGMVLIAYALGLYAVLSRRRPARAQLALAANR